ncbi:hypothetical protein LTR49_027538 [Elasticomyces elasticus]|nr:hypothetical protein LTR49_027538 [Elasticomyces elasticus]
MSLLLGPSSGPAPLVAPASSPQPWGYFVNSTIYQPTGNEGLFYPRFTELEDGTILATTSLSGPVPDYFSVFESTDGGASWTYISNLTDQVNGLGFTAQPALHELTFDLGAYKKGTILGGGNSWGNTSTNIDLYASIDRGRTWEFVSHVANGGPPNTTNGATPVVNAAVRREPRYTNSNAYPFDGEVIAYYSDQRDPLHGRKLAHQILKDLINWSSTVNDVAYDNYLARPGMTIFGYIPPIDKWILVHEIHQRRPIPRLLQTCHRPARLRQQPGCPLLVNGTIAPSSSPYVVWTPEPKGSKYGIIVVSDNDHRSVFTNQAGGTEDAWEEHGTPAAAVYSRAIEIFKKRPDHLLIYGGDMFNGLMEGDQLPFSATVLDINWVLEKAPEDYSVS